MDRMTRHGDTNYSGRYLSPSNDIPKSHDNNDDMQWQKEQEFASDRLDSGIDSYASFDEYRSSSIRSTYASSIDQSVTNQMSSMSITSPPVSTQSTNIDDRLPDYKSVDTTEEREDSGLGSYSLQEENRQEVIKRLHQDRIPDTIEENNEEVNQVLQWFLPDDEGDTFLQLAIIQRKVDLAFNVIQMCTLPALLDIANENKQTALHLAVLTNQPQLLRCLVAYGADVKCKDKQGNTPLHLACERGLAFSVEMLTTKLDPQEDPGFQTFNLPQNVNERNYLGFTPLHLAAINNRPDVINILINNLKCDVNVADLKSGRTALHHAVERQSMESTNLILRSHPDVNALTYDECAPLHLAAALGLRHEATALLDHKADLFLITRDDFDVFELSVHNRRLYHTLKDAEKKIRNSTHFMG